MVATDTTWNGQSSCTSCMFHIRREVGVELKAFANGMLILVGKTTKFTVHFRKDNSMEIQAWQSV